MAARPVLAERYGDDVVVDFCMRVRQPLDQVAKVDALVGADLRCSTQDPVLPALPAIRGCHLGPRAQKSQAPPPPPPLPDQFFRSLENIKWEPIARTVEPYYEDPLYIEALAQSVERALRRAGAQAQCPRRPRITGCAQAVTCLRAPLPLPVPEDPRAC